MNYIIQIREFYNWLEINPLGTSEIALWHALMHVNNKTVWSYEFSVPIKILEFKTGLSRSAIYRARNTLKQKGLIDFKERSSNQSSIYTVFQIDTQGGTHDGTQGGTHDGTQGGTINKHKHLEDTNVSPKKEKDTNVSSKKKFIPKEILDEWNAFYQMRKKIKKPLTDKAVEMALEKLNEMAPGNHEMQKKILNQSTFHCWQGLFELKTDNNQENNQSAEKIYGVFNYD